MAAKKRILIVDDERDMVDLLRLRLESVGYEVDAAYDGQEGLMRARKRKPDLIILDVMMPRLDGRQVCRLLKFDDAFTSVPIIMLTALGQERDRQTGESVGADEYIVKPFDGQVLLDAVKRLLRV